MSQDKIWDYYQNEGLESGGFSDARQRFMLRYLESGSSVLNVGVGSGELEHLALDKGVEIYSLDPSRKAIEQLQERLGLAGRAQVGYVQAAPFDDNMFDIVVLSEVLEHLDDETLASALSEMLRVLKPGGTLVVSTPYSEVLETQMVICPDCGKVFHRWGHIQSFDKDSMRNLISKSGFSSEKVFVTTFVNWHRKGLLNLIKSTFRIALASVGQKIADPHIVVIAKKAAVVEAER